ncbi:MAG: ABC transporter ATP-binding protein [Candidatus Firestonebacteria bacterium]
MLTIESGLQVNGISKTYKSEAGELKVLKKISFNAVPKDTVAITGPSGSGKSTLLSILGRLEDSDSGEIILDGINISGLKGSELYSYRNKSAGFIFQEHFLLPQCTALENVLLPSIPEGRGRQLQRRAQELLSKLGLSSLAGSFPARLSGGEKQRVAIARAMLNSPKLLLCDEPTGSLDAENGRKTADMFLKLAALEKIIVIMVTHNQQLADKFEMVYRLENGLLKKAGT